MKAFVPGVTYVGLVNKPPSTTLFVSPFEVPPYAVGLVIGYDPDRGVVYVKWDSKKPWVVLSTFGEHRPDELMIID
jgi:hypothetical protein